MRRPLQLRCGHPQNPLKVGAVGHTGWRGTAHPAVQDLGEGALTAESRGQAFLLNVLAQPD